MIAGDWSAAGEILHASYPRRKMLSPNITTPQMDHLIETAHANGAIATKVCGAGGGGCIAFYCEEGRRIEVETSLNAQPGAEVLDWKVNNAGLTVTVSNQADA
jgi:D-glycero-alpha-D-manno-heptose-7-phosphate kinase